MNEEPLKPKPKPEKPTWIIPSERVEETRSRLEIGREEME